eukprot:m.99983 g.99983  ORF g.99983 m.99983 type:complete len:54 (+) comp20643_c0_seq1:3472-3633(+)
MVQEGLPIERKMASSKPPLSPGEADAEDVEEGFGQSVVLTARIRSILRGCEFR